MIRFLLPLAAAAAAMTGVAAAKAQPAYAVDVAPQARVAFGDLSLATPQGRAAMEARMSAAIARICPAADIRDLGRGRAVEACRAAARASSAEQLAAASARALAQAHAAAPAGERSAVAVN